MSDSFVQVAVDSTGKKIQTFEHVVGADTVEAQAVVLVDSTGAPYPPLIAAAASDAIAQTSTTKALTPPNIPFQMFAWNWRDILMTEPASSANIGSGTGSQGIMQMDLQSGATASSGRYTSMNAQGFYPGASVGGFNFSKPIGFAVSVIVRATAPANGRTRFFIIASSLGAGTAYGNTAGVIGKPLKKAIGIEIQQNAIYGAVHDGTTYTTTTLSQNAVDETYCTIFCIRSGSGSWDYYVNGIFAATVTGGPAAGDTAFTGGLVWAVENNASAANMQSQFLMTKIFQGLI